MSFKKKYNPKQFQMKGFIQNSFFALRTFGTRLKKSIEMMTSSERKLSVLTFIVLLALLSMQGKAYYDSRTKLVAGAGGTYTEVVYGELNYINPVLAATDTDTSVSHLLFDGLVHYDSENNVIPTIATNWEVSEDKLKYTFALRGDVMFHDGRVLTANDVVYTVGLMQQPEFKSPYYDLWKDVVVSAVGDDKVTFELSKIYGPFIYNCDFGILPSYLSMDEESKKNVGTGPFKFINSEKQDQKVTKISLKRNEGYFQGPAYLDRVDLSFLNNKESAIEKYEGLTNSGLSGVEASKENSSNLSFKTSKRLALIPNLRRDTLKTKEVRAQIFGDQPLAEKLTLGLITPDSPVQRQKADELKKQYESRNIILNVKYLKPTEMKTALDAKDFDLLLYGFDFGHDRDPYTFWHSSQVAKLNFAGYSDKGADLLLETARMTIDNGERNAKYDQFFETVKGESLAVFFDPIKYNFTIDSTIKGVSSINGTEAFARYFEINKWFIKEKRARK